MAFLGTVTVRAALLEMYNPAMNVPGQTVTEGPLPVAQLPAAASFTTSVSTITMGVTLPSWVVSGMNVYDVTNAKQIGTVSSGAGTTTLTLTGNASNASAGSADVLQFGFTPSDVSVGFAAGADIRGIVQLAQLKCSEAIALLQYLSTDVVTAGQDAAANTLITNAINNLS